MRPAWPLRTERLTLRPWQASDFEAFFEIHGDPDAARWLYNEPRDEASARAHFEVKKNATLREEDDWMSCGAFAGDDLVVDVSFHWVSVEHRTGEIGYMTHPRHQGRGYATEASAAILGWAFDDAGFHRVIGRIEPRNVPSGRVLEKLGMRKEAHFVENEWVKGEWSSEAVYAILEREWRS
ncbi:MAG TPA: GNAT family N-acetyltransferase [Gaiellaceae bacterium]